jgi:hypothetical protein
MGKPRADLFHFLEFAHSWPGRKGIADEYRAQCDRRQETSHSTATSFCDLWVLSHAIFPFSQAHASNHSILHLYYFHDKIATFNADRGVR